MDNSNAAVAISVQRRQAEVDGAKSISICRSYKQYLQQYRTDYQDDN